MPVIVGGTFDGNARDSFVLTRFIDRLAHIFTWWNGRTVNTAFSTWRHGERVGTDEFGNVYYRSKGGKIDPALGFERRWVIYNGYAEGSMVPTGWYGWLHHTTSALPTEEGYVPKDWQKPHLPNMTGTPRAWRPPGSTLRANARPLATGDYEAWSPEG